MNSPKIQPCKRCKNPFSPILNLNGLVQSKFCPECRVILERLKRMDKNKAQHHPKRKVVKSLKNGIKTDLSKTRAKSRGARVNIKELDRVFSLFIRQRDADKNGMVKCISCGKIVEWKKSDCGHYINRRHMSTRFDEQNCNPQCRSCNRFSEGNMEGYRAGLIEKYGAGTPEKLYIKKFNTVHLNQAEINLLTEHYKKIIFNFFREKDV